MGFKERNNFGNRFKESGNLWGAPPKDCLKLAWRQGYISYAAKHGMSRNDAYRVHRAMELFKESGILPSNEIIQLIPWEVFEEEVRFRGFRNIEHFFNRKSKLIEIRGAGNGNGNSGQGSTS